MSKITSETKAFSDLPVELEWEILSRVPAASLTRLGTTCKRWYALFKDPRFIDKNSSKSATTLVICNKNSGTYSVNINLNDPTIEFIGKLNSLKDSEHVEISQIFVCEGLLLCTTKDKRLVVWNPCTGQTRWIQPIIRPTMYENYALGYETNDKLFNTYKILRYSTYRNFKETVEIYEFSSDSWRFIDQDITHNWAIWSHTGVSLKGNSYWVAWDVINSNIGLFLLRFDFKRERFERLSLPFDRNDFKVRVVLSVVRQEKLYVLLDRRYPGGKEMRLWTTDTKIDETEDSKVQYSLLLDFGDIDVKFVNSFLVEEENKLVVCCSETMVCIIGLQDCKIHVCKQLGAEEIAHGPVDLYRLISYVPSLIRIR